VSQDYHRGHCPVARHIAHIPLHGKVLRLAGQLVSSNCDDFLDFTDSRADISIVA
jgi:hypothetical protein